MKIGIDIGGSHIASGVVDEYGQLIQKETKDISTINIENEEKAKKIIIEIISSQIETLLKKLDYEICDISKIGIAAPGNPTKEAIRNLVNLKIKYFEIGKILEEKYDAKVNIKNDGKCSGLAEKKYGNLKKYKDCIFLCIGTGVGSAVFMDNDLLEPELNAGFEFGHMIIDKNGPKCNCGNNGCFETYASMKRFKKEIISKFKLDSDVASEDVQKYVRQNIDKKEVKIFVDNYINNLAIGVSNIINIFEPEAICFGGSFAYYSDIFLPKLKQQLEQYVFNKEVKCDLLSTKFKNDGGIIGASII